MANADNSIITGKFSGSLGKELVFRDWDGKTVVAKSPKSRRSDPTEKQLVAQENFLIASRYAKAISDPKAADKGLAEAYARALRPRQNVYSRALEDFLTPPVVKPFETRGYKGVVGDKIVVRAMDDFRVTKVEVEIYEGNGDLLETGNAVQQTNGIDWTYTATQVNNLLVGSKIKAIATDVPGNIGTLEMVV